MTNIYALILGVITSASLMAAYGDPSSAVNPGSNPGYRPGNPGSSPANPGAVPGNPGSSPELYNQKSPYDQGTNPTNPTNPSFKDSSSFPNANSTMNRNPQLSDNSDTRVNMQRDVNNQRAMNGNAQSTFSNQTNTYAPKSANMNGDAQILTQIQDRVKGAYKQYNINVNVSNGIATLTGSVGSQLDKDAIEKDVRNVPGISKVVNQLTIQK